MAVSHETKKRIEKYFDNSRSAPLFVAVDSEGIVKDFSGQINFAPNANKIRLCEFFKGDDRPDLSLVRYELNRRFRENDHYRAILLGLGEYLAFRGAAEAERELRAFYDLRLLNNAKLLVPLRCVANVLQKICRRDPRFQSVCILDAKNSQETLNLEIVSPKITLPVEKGNKLLCRSNEAGKPVRETVAANFNELVKKFGLGVKNVCAQTAQQPGDDFLSYVITRVDDVFDVLKGMLRNLDDSFRALGTEEQWSSLYEELVKAGSFEKVLEKFDVPQDPDEALLERLPTTDFQGWLWFLELKRRAAANLIPARRAYLLFVLNSTDRFEEFRKRLLHAILETPGDSPMFRAFYNERKKLLKLFDRDEIGKFIRANRTDKTMTLRRLTDATEPERREIVSFVAQNGWNVDDIRNVYPCLADYLAPFVFHAWDDASTERFTQYFERYRKQKLANKLEPDFKEEVEQLAFDGYCNLLPTRDAAVDELNKECKEGKKITLLWVDALGAEFVPFIAQLCQQHRLACDVTLARANLPTITSQNRQFYEDWDGERDMTKELDETKHKEKGGFNYQKTPLPIHLERELEIVRNTIKEAEARLNGGAEKVVIASDHGASRLAVLSGQEEKCDGDARGEHSGRCCPVGSGNVPKNVPGLMYEESWYVFANYTRFPHSRKANVEVHGGATLEEVVVPVIVVAKKGLNGPGKIEFTSANVKKGSSSSPTTLELFAENGLVCPELEISINGTLVRRAGARKDDERFSFAFPELKKLGVYAAKVYDNGRSVADLKFKLISGASAINSDFEDKFKDELDY
ncbi:MAG: BREX-4 system phosphatase PglZ [Thermoguttaceae bacterium]|nr:BREX-4 system phosphatase PglZ [Thermoguttaceae bacterium]